MIIVYIMPILVQSDFKRHECWRLNYEVRQIVPVVYGSWRKGVPPSSFYCVFLVNLLGMAIHMWHFRWNKQLININPNQPVHYFIHTDHIAMSTPVSEGW